MRIRSLSLSVVSSLALSGAASSAVEVKDEGGKVSVKIDGKPFTEYVYQGAQHTYFWPVLGPGGQKMTRAFPMAEVEGEERDHPHHRSLWYCHGKVDGVDFWSEQKTFNKVPPGKKEGSILHDKFLEVKGGEKTGVISSQQKWENPDGTIALTSTQTVRFHQTTPNERVLDFDITLHAPKDREVTMQETKEGSMAMRVAETMRLKPNKANAGKDTGHLLNSEGLKDDAVWGRPAAWVDYTGPVDGKLMGIAIFDHPANPRHPTKWHARNYGLFAANPFMGADPTDKNAPKGQGDLKIPAGQSVAFKYRIYIHEGDSAQAKTAERFAEYAKSK